VEYFAAINGFKNIKKLWAAYDDQGIIDGLTFLAISNTFLRGHNCQIIPSCSCMRLQSTNGRYSIETIDFGVRVKWIFIEIIETRSSYPWACNEEANHAEKKL
jgi:hypothetical protein